MTQALVEFLKRELDGEPADAYVFPSEAAGRGRVYQMNTQLKRCVRRAGLPDWVTPHTLRHTMATNAAQAGVDPATIQRMGGWKTRAMVERYTHAASRREGKAGRASCRERVGQFVEIWVGGVSLKKKKKR